MRHEVETRLEPEANIAKSNNSKDQESKSQIISEGLHVATIQSSTINARSPRSVTFRPLILMVKSEFRSGKPAQAGRISNFAMFFKSSVIFADPLIAFTNLR